MDPNFIPYRVAASYLTKILETNDTPLPKIGIICGSGLSNLSDELTSSSSSTSTNTTTNAIPLTVPYSKIPGFPSHCTVPGHKGEIVFGSFPSSSNIPCMCFRGRFHSYEGHSMNITALPVRIMRCMGVKLVIVTNAAGGLNPEYNVGDIVCIMDHFALPMMTGRNPLMGKNDDALGPRFPPTSNIFQDELQQVVLDCAKDLKHQDLVRKDGTYCFVSGPQYESKAECNFLRKSVGGDAVGMSTIPEVLAAHHSGMKVICLSLITNQVIMKDSDKDKPAASHEEVLEAVANSTKQMQSLVQEIIASLGKDNGYLHQLQELPAISLTTAGTGEKIDYDVPLRYLMLGAGIVSLIASTLILKRK